jgi:hypothetical protein
MGPDVMGFVGAPLQVQMHIYGNTSVALSDKGA